MGVGDAYLQVAADGAGKKVQTRELRVLLDDGTIATVEMQVITIADKNGRPIDLDAADKLGEIAGLLREIKTILELHEGIL